MPGQAFKSIPFAILKCTCTALVYWFKQKLIIFMQNIIGHAQFSILSKIDVSKVYKLNILLTVISNFKCLLRQLRKLCQGLGFL